jgi:hypothetical protein
MAQMDTGIGGLPAGAMDNEDAFAGGGIVAFAEAGAVEGKKETQKDKFIREMTPAATLAAKELETTPQAVLSMWALETGWGNPKAVQGENNYGNIQYQTGPNPERGILGSRSGTDAGNKRSFVDYDSPESFARDFVRNIKNPTLYPGLKSGPKTAEEFLSQIPQYAEDKNYQAKVMGLHNTSFGGNSGAAGGEAAPTKTGIASTAPDTDQQVNPYAVAGVAAGAGAAALPPVKTGIASGPNVPAVFRSNRVPPAGVPPAGAPPAGVPPAGVPPAGKPSLFSRGLGALGRFVVSPYTTGAGLAFHSSEAGAGSDIVPGKPAGRPPTPQEVDALLREGKISDSEAREILRRLPVAPDAKKPPADDVSRANRDKFSYDRELDGTKLDSRNVAPKESAPKPDSFSFDKFLTDEIKSIIDARKKQVPVTREDRLKQFKADQEAFGLKDDVGKEQVDRLAALAGQAKQDRDVGLWLSAATGFFAMGAGKSQYALQNFAAGAGIGIEQANSALGAYSKRQNELNQAQFEVEKARRAEKRGDLESYRTFTQRAEEKEQAADDRYSNRMIKLFEIKQRGQALKLRVQELKQNTADNLELKTQRLRLDAERAFNDAWEKHKKSTKGLLDQGNASGTGPEAVAAQASLDAEEKKLRDNIFGSTFAAAGVPNPYASGGGQSNLDRDAERIMAGG